MGSCLLVAGLVLSCAKSHTSRDESSGDTRGRHAKDGVDQNTEAGAGGNYPLGGESAITKIDYEENHPVDGEDTGTDMNPMNSSSEQAPSSTETTKVPIDPEKTAPELGIVAQKDEQLPIGVWVGQTKETIAFACSSSLRVEIQVSPREDSDSAFGFVIFGEGEPPPPVKDPDVGYPPEDNREDLLCRQRSPSEGFAYTILEGHISKNGRFRFRIAVTELYEPWCALQTVGNGMSGFSCRPELSNDEWAACSYQSGDISSPDDTECPLDYGKFWLCEEWGPCICMEDGCSVNMNRTLLFDLMIEGAEIEGVITNLSIGESPPTEVRLRKVR